MTRTAPPNDFDRSLPAGPPNAKTVPVGGFAHEARSRASRPRRAPRAPSGARAPPAAGGRPEGARSIGYDPVLDLPTALSRRPASVLIHGEPRDLVNLAAHALVTWVGAEYSWIDVRMPDQPPTGLSPVRLGLIPDHRLVVVHRLDEMAPYRLDPESARSMVRGDERGEAMAQLAQFVQLPPPVQTALAKTTPGTRPSILVIANAHRFAALYNSDNVPKLLHEFTSLGSSLFVTFADEPTGSRRTFDFVFHVTGESAARWTEATFSVERSGGMWPSLEGLTAKLGEIEPLARHLAAAVRAGSADP